MPLLEEIKRDTEQVTFLEELPEKRMALGVFHIGVVMREAFLEKRKGVDMADPVDQLGRMVLEVLKRIFKKGPIKVLETLEILIEAAPCDIGFLNDHADGEGLEGHLGIDIPGRSQDPLLLFSGKMVERGFRHGIILYSFEIVWKK